MLQDFLNPIGTVIAFFRPELTKLYRRIVKPKKLEITEKGDIRLWFSQLGPIVDIQCEVKSVSRNITVTLAEIELTHTESGDKRIMTWVQPFTIHRDWPGFDRRPVQSRSSFSIAADAVTLFFSMFYDVGSSARMEGEFSKLGTEWELLVREAASFGGEAMDPLDLSDWNNPDLTKLLPQVYRGFRDLGYGKTAEERIRGVFDLTPGQYQLKLVFHVSGWRKVVSKFWYFSLSESGVNALKGKADALVECSCYSIGRDFNPMICRYNS